MKELTLDKVLKTPAGNIVHSLLSDKDVTTLQLAQMKDTRMTKIKWWRNKKTSLGGYVLWNRSKISLKTHLEILKNYNLCYSSMTEIPTIMETDYFRDEFAFLSNMSPVNLYEDKMLSDPETGYGVLYLENLYQSLKFSDKSLRMLILKANPGQAKTLGRTSEGMDSTWGTKKIQTMERLLRKKFEIRSLKELLISTGKLKIEEVNHWYDHYWGICGGVGDNKLGELLEKIRNNLKMELF